MAAANLAQFLVGGLQLVAQALGRELLPLELLLQIGRVRTRPEGGDRGEKGRAVDDVHGVLCPQKAPHRIMARR